jgi:flagellar biosynthesis repressor protein FlbT
MPLAIHIRRGKKIIINGAVLENASERPIKFLLKNRAEILRCDDVLAPDQAVTPAGRIYYALQCVYLFPHSKSRHLSLFFDLVEGYRTAAPSVNDVVERLLALVHSGQFYDALKLARELIVHERECLRRLDRHLMEPPEVADEHCDARRELAVAGPREPAGR